MKRSTTLVPLRPKILWGYGLTCVTSTITETGQAFILAMLAAVVMGESALAPGLAVVLAFLYLIPTGLTDWLNSMLRFRVVAAYEADLRSYVLKKTLSSPLPHRMALSRKSSDLQGAVINDVSMIAEDYVGAMLTILLSVLLLLGGLLGTAYIDWRLIPVVLLLSIAALLLPKLADKSLRRTQRDVADKRNALVEVVTAVAGGLESILSVARPRRSYSVLTRLIEDARHAENRRNDVRTAVWTLTWVFGMVIIFGMWGIGALGSRQGWLTVAQVVALAQLMAQVAGPFQAIAEKYAQVVAGRQQLNDLTATLAINAGREPHDVIELRKGAQHALVVDGVSYSVDDQPILQETSFRVSQGARVLISGPSGAGKSTLLRAIAGTIDASGIVATGDGELTERQGRIVLATQRSFVVPGAVSDSVESDPEELLNRYPAIATPLAAAFSDPESTTATLSGGETKRLHLLRTLEAEPKVLLLDEATTGLDPYSAAAALQELNATSTDAVLAVIHDLPGDPKELGFTHRLSVCDGVCGELELIC